MKLLVRLAFLSLTCLLTNRLTAEEAIPPVRTGDQVEVLSFSTWYTGTVESYQDGKAMVKYEWSNIERTSEFPLEKMRFPNGEGHWMVWKDASGKFRVEARYISRTKTEVTIRTSDGRDVTVPIANLHPTLRKEVAKTPVTSDLTAPVHVGDRVEVEYFSKWYEGTVTSVQSDKVTVEYDYRSRKSTGTFKFEDVRFPNGEGHWLIWKDASGEFKVEARFISRTKDEVTIRKTDGNELTVPIKSLHASLRQVLAKTPITSDLNKIDGAIPIRVGDQVQARSGSTWYDGVVKEVKVIGALIEYDQGAWGRQTETFDLKDLRYPNGEGHWREWSDASGDFKISARYMSRDETHVTILREDNQEIRVPIDKLSSQLRKLLRETPIIARRPRLVALAGAELIGDVSDEKMSAREKAESVRENLLQRSRAMTGSAETDAPDLAGLTLNIGTPVSAQTISLPQGGAAFPLKPKHTVDKVVPVGGSDGWVVVSVKGNDWKEKFLTTLHWASLANRRAGEGPRFFPDQRLAAYSSRQNRAVMYNVKGSWDEPNQLSTYRLAPGEKSARPEITVDIPKRKHAFNREPIRVELIGDNQMLVGFGGTVSLWDLEQPRVLYQVGGLKSHAFQLSIDHQYFAVESSSATMSVHAVATGQRIGAGKWEGSGYSTACFSRDGERLVVASDSGIFRWDLAGGSPLDTLPIGGIRIDRATPLADLGAGWIVAGPQIYSSGLRLIVWRYDGGGFETRARQSMVTGSIDPNLMRAGSGVSIKYQRMLGRQMLVVATANEGKGAAVLVGVATVPHKDAIEMMKKVDPETVRMLVRGSRIKIDTSVDPKILTGLRRAAHANDWVEDVGSEIVLTGSAGRGEPQTLTYRTISFGSGGRGEETHTVSPWIQTAKIVYKEKTAWRTSMGGVPYSVTLREGQSLGSELQKSSNSNYGLFERLKIPDEIIYPRYQLGLGQTILTPKGFVDTAK